MPIIFRKAHLIKLNGGSIYTGAGDASSLELRTTGRKDGRVARGGGRQHAQG